MSYQILTAAELVEQCCNNDSRAWEEFIRRFQRPIALMIVRVMRRWGMYSPTVIDDLLQETYFLLCANEYTLLRGLLKKRPDSVESMLRVIAANVTHDYLRAKTAKKRGRDYQQIDDPDHFLMENALVEDGATRIEAEIQLDQIDRLLQTPPNSATVHRDRAIFWMYFQSGMTAQAISEIPSIRLSAKGVESSIHRTLEYIRGCFKIKRR